MARTARQVVPAPQESLGGPTNGPQKSLGGPTNGPQKSLGGPANGPQELPSRAARHARILTLLAERRVRSQGELAPLLAEAGVPVTQATLSRDLDELGAVKLRTPDGGQPVYVVPQDG